MRDLRQVQQQRAVVMIEFRGVRFKVGGGFEREGEQ